MTFSQSQFIKLKPDDTAALYQKVEAELSGQVPKTSQISALSCALSFYPGAALVDMTLQEADHGVHLFILRDAARHMTLNWTAAQLAQANQLFNLLLDSETVAEYARFYLYFARPQGGRITVIESIDDIPWSDDPSPAARKSLGRIIVPFDFVPGNAPGSFTTPVTFLFGQSLFRADLDIQADGAVSLRGERLEVEQLPILSEPFAA